jgi:hypothetical protein
VEKLKLSGPAGAVWSALALRKYELFVNARLSADTAHLSASHTLFYHATHGADGVQIGRKSNLTTDVLFYAKILGRKWEIDCVVRVVRWRAQGRRFESKRSIPLPLGNISPKVAVSWLFVLACCRRSFPLREVAVRS